MSSAYAHSANNIHFWGTVLLSLRICMLFFHLALIDLYQLLYMLLHSNLLHVPSFHYTSVFWITLTWSWKFISLYFLLNLALNIRLVLTSTTWLSCIASTGLRFVDSCIVLLYCSITFANNKWQSLPVCWTLSNDLF